MTKKTIGILSGVGVVAITATAISVPLSLKNDDYVIPGKIIKNAEIINSHEYDSFKKEFQKQTLGITGVVVKSINDDDKNLIVIVTGRNKTDSVKVIFNVVKATGKTTILEVEKGPSNTTSMIEDALKKSLALNTSKMKIASIELMERIKVPGMVTPIPSNVIEAIKKLGDIALNELSHVSKKSSSILKSEILTKIKEALESEENKHLIKQSHISLTENDTTGSLSVDIDGIAEKTFVITGFLTDAKELADVKLAATSEIDEISIPDKNDALHDEELFPAIATAIKAVKEAIQAKTNIQDLASILTTQKDNVNNAINAYSTSTGTNLINAKINAKKEIDDIANPIQDDTKYDADLFQAITEIRTTAKGAIDNASNMQNLASVLTTQKDNVNNAITAYNASTGTDKELADAKINAIQEIESISVPDQDDTLHDADLFVDITDAITAAKAAINIAGNPGDVTTALNTEKTKVDNAIIAYTGSTGTIQDLINAINDAKTIIDNIDVPDQDNAAHQENLFAAIDIAKTAAKEAIDLATNLGDVTTVLNTETTKVNDAITTYTNSTGTDLINAKDTAKTAIDEITIPTRDNALYDGSLFNPIIYVQLAAKRAIDNALDPTDVTRILNIERGKVNTAITAYTNSIGTTQTLINAKNIAKTTIDNIAVLEQDNAAHQASLYGAIADAKTAAKIVIDQGVNPGAVTRILSGETAKINTAIIAYTNSIGTTQTLINAKNTAKTAIDNIAVIEQDNAVHQASLYRAIADAKTTAKTAIDQAANPGAVTSTLNSETTKVNTAITAYTNSIGTTQTLINAKTDAKGEINRIPVPVKNDGNHEESLFGAIAEAKSAADTAIDRATNPGQVATALNTERVKINTAITAYTSSTGTTQTLINAKNTAKTAIDNITVIEQDNAAHQASLYGAIADAKNAAKTAIDEAANPDAVTSTLNSETTKVNDVITAYTNSIGTTQTLINAKTDAKGEINRIPVPVKNDGNHDESLFGAIAEAKSAADTAIDRATNPGQVATALNTERVKINTAITAYTSSTGTTQALIRAKNTAKTAIDNIAVLEQDNAAHQASLYGAIADAKNAAKTAIDEATNPDAVTNTLSGETAKINTAITAYTSSTGTTQALISAKNTAKTAIDNIPVIEQDNAVHQASLYGAIADAKNAAKTAIDEAANPDAVTRTLSEETVKVNTAITAYKTSTGTILINAKHAAEEEIDNIDSPFPNNLSKDINLFAIIDNTKELAKEAINNATSTESLVIVLNTEKAKVNAAISAYSASTATFEKTKAYAIWYVDNITVIYDAEDDRYDIDLYNAINTNITNAKNAFNGISTSSIRDILGTYHLWKSNVERALFNYINDFNAAALLQEISDIKVSFTKEINDMETPEKNDILHNAALFANIARTKGIVLRAIESATTIIDINNAYWSDERQNFLNAIEVYKLSSP